MVMTRRWVLALVQVIMMIIPAQVTWATLYPVQDTRPLLSTGDAQIQWWAGGAAYTLSSSGVVRLNFRGVHVYPPATHVRAGLEAHGWVGVPCNASAWALCGADVGSAMPWSLPRVPERQNTVASGWDTLGCSDGKGKVLTSQSVYDISACDIMDEGLDVVYSQGVLYHRHTSMPVWRYWTSVALAVILVRALSYNVQGIWITSKERSTHAQWPALVGAVTLLVLVLLDLDYVYTTAGDQVFFWCSVMYVLFYLILHGVTRGGPATKRLVQLLLVRGSKPNKRIHEEQVEEQELPLERPVFNVIVAALQILAVRLYTAAETPYNLLLLGMLASRVWIKLLTITRERKLHLSLWHTLPLVIDSLYLSLCTELAFSGTRELVVAVLGVAFLAAKTLTETA
jgi:hypothetical protein